MTMTPPSTVQKLLAIAASEVGTTENPPGTNRSKYGKWFGYDGVPWCGIFVSWYYAKAGIPLPRIGFASPGFAGCQTAVAWFRKKGRVVDSPAPGDIVFFDWNGDGRYDHTGIYVRELPGRRFETIEGNTALNNQSNGGQVMRRERARKNVLFVHPIPTTP